MEYVTCFTVTILAVIITLMIVDVRRVNFTSSPEDDVYAPSYLAAYSSPYYYFS